MLFRLRGQITYVLLTRAPLYSPSEESFLVRLACVKHAASVHSEPGSNSPYKLFLGPVCYLVFKDQFLLQNGKQIYIISVFMSTHFFTFFVLNLLFAFFFLKSFSNSPFGVCPNNEATYNPLTFFLSNTIKKKIRENFIVKDNTLI